MSRSKERLVFARDGDRVGYWGMSGSRRRARWCSLKHWRRWSKGAFVTRVSPEEAAS